MKRSFRKRILKSFFENLQKKKEKRRKNEEIVKKEKRKTDGKARKTV
jgi:hypothetical protein